jgi:hypothetical protein
VDDLFNEAKENRNDDGGFEGLAEDYEENGDGKNVRGHGGWKKESRSCLGKGSLGLREADNI